MKMDKFELFRMWVYPIIVITIIGLFKWISYSYSVEGFWYKYGRIFSNGLIISGIVMLIINAIYHTIKYFKQKEN